MSERSTRQEVFESSVVSRTTTNTYLRNTESTNGMPMLTNSLSLFGQLHAWPSTTVPRTQEYVASLSTIEFPKNSEVVIELVSNATADLDVPSEIKKLKAAVFGCVLQILRAWFKVSAVPRIWRRRRGQGIPSNDTSLLSKLASLTVIPWRFIPANAPKYPAKPTVAYTCPTLFFWHEKKTKKIISWRLKNLIS